MDPQNATTATDTAIQFAMFDTLIGWTPDYQPENHLAEEVSSDATATVWTVRLKPGLTWQDGKPVTADDIVFSFQRICNTKAPLPSASSLGGLTPDGVVKIDDRTVELRLPAPNSVLTDGLALRTTMMVPVGFDPQKPIGCGPFRLKTFNPGQEISFTAFDDYWGDGPYVDELSLVEIADPTARVNALLSGTVDAMTDLPRSQKEMAEGGGLAALEAKTGGWIPFTMRIDVKPFDDVRVRQAFRLIVDRQQMLDQAYAGLGWVANDIYSPYDPGYPKDLPQRVQDLEQARSLLKQAGYDGDLTVDLVTSDSISGDAVSAAQVFAQQAKGAGVTVNVKKVDGSVMYGDDYLKWPFAMDWWLMRNYLVQASAGSTPTAPYNETHWKDAQWQKLVDEAFRTADADKRNELVSEAAAIDYDKGGYIIWSFKNQLDAYSQTVGGLVPDVSGLPLGGYRYANYYFV